MAKLIAEEGKSSIKKCAFCKYYYDPTNEVISPRRGARGKWEYDSNAVKPCREKFNSNVSAQHTCSKFECKL